MFSLIKESCPYQNWTSVARERCQNPDHYHCLKDEYGRIGWVCSEPVWVEKDRCPVFNVGANKLDTTSCSQNRCPPYNYRSNDIDVEYACRYILERKGSTTPFDTKASETNSTSIIVALTVLILIMAVVILAGILFYKCRRKFSKNNGSQEESNEFIQQTATKTQNTAKEPTKFDRFQNFFGWDFRGSAGW